MQALRARGIAPRSLSFARSLHSTPASRVLQVPIAQQDGVDLGWFRSHVFEDQKPLVIRHGHPVLSPNLPAAQTWFNVSHQKDSGASISPSAYLHSFETSLVRFELMHPQMSSEDDVVQRFITWLLRDSDRPQYMAMGEYLSREVPVGDPNASQRLLQCTAPLGLLFAALEFSKLHPRRPLRQLYVAQAPVPDLPQKLKDDLPTPEIVREAGKGDIYGSSVWLGLEPTYTPLHRDPNPNLFCQLYSAKVIRLLPPVRGDALFRKVQMATRSAVSSRIRGEEMMQGEERKVFYEAVWEAQDVDGMQEARLEAGDALFIPKGWWHSVASSFADGRLNGSVNWWFR